jgi:hypothetical protein
MISISGTGDQRVNRLLRLRHHGSGGYSGGSIACSWRIERCAVFGEGKPTEVNVASSCGLDQRLRACSSESHTPMMKSASSLIAQRYHLTERLGKTLALVEPNATARTTLSIALL